MHPAEFILYVADQARARDFYRHVLAAEPVLDVPGAHRRGHPASWCVAPR